jgi:hypothetical protein
MVFALSIVRFGIIIVLLSQLTQMRDAVKTD